MQAESNPPESDRARLPSGSVRRQWSAPSRLLARLEEPVGSRTRSADEVFARVDVVELESAARDGYAKICRVMEHKLRVIVAKRSVFILTSYLRRHPDHVVRNYLRAIHFVAEVFFGSGANNVILYTDASADHPKSSSPKLIVTNAALEPRQPVYCAARFSGWLRLQLPEALLSADVVISAPLSDVKGAPLLSSTNLLGLIAEHADVMPGPGQLAGLLGNLVTDVAATVKPHFSWNFATDSERADGRLTVVMGPELSAVDATTCTERGINPDKVLPLRVLPSWLGPITPARIRIYRHDATSIG